MYGSHLSIAKGLDAAVAKATSLSFETVQVFTKNQQQWKVKPLEQSVIDAWCTACRTAKFKDTVAHDSYLINLGSPDDALRRKSIELFTEEVRRCDQLGIPYLVTHPGAHLGTRDDPSDEAAGLARIVASLDDVLDVLPSGPTTVCLESTAGQGSSLGHRLEHLATILEAVKRPDRVGVCFDTAHLFAAGYDFRGERYATFMTDVERTLGKGRVKVWHLNDSKKPLGSRVDRHDHIGHGTIGLEGFRPIVLDKRWKKTPKILETAKEDHESGRPWDAVNLETLKALEK
jgi:deoxyribonuclease IV